MMVEGLTLGSFVVFGMALGGLHLAALARQVRALIGGAGAAAALLPLLRVPLTALGFVFAATRGGAALGAMLGGFLVLCAAVVYRQRRAP